MANKNGKSLKVNMMLNAVKGLMGIIFPLISFPYVSKVLGVENIGRYNFSHSIINYFVLIAGLGFTTYAIREGSRIKNQKSTFQIFANEIFTMNLCSMTISYILLGILLINVSKVQEYQVLILIFSIEILFRTIGIEWIYSIYEEFAYITIRSIIFQLFSIICLFLFVKTENDVWKYVSITVFANAGSNIMNYVHSRKYCRVRVCRIANWKLHMKPVLVLFAMTATTTIYVSSGTTFLGMMTSDYCVGIYAVSSKVYSIVKTILASVLVVSIPRLSSLLSKDNLQEFNEVASDIFKTLLTVMLPAMVGIVVLRNEIILLISDSEYIRATESLVLLAIALVFCMGAWFWGQCILVPLKKETVVLKVTIVSAIVNAICNIILIPIWEERAAAFATLLSEFVAFVVCAYCGSKKVKLSGIGITIGKVLVGCVCIIIVCVASKLIMNNGTLHIIVAVITSVISYFIIELFLKNEALQDIKNVFTRRKV